MNDKYPAPFALEDLGTALADEALRRLHRESFFYQVDCLADADGGEGEK